MSRAKPRACAYSDCSELITGKGKRYCDEHRAIRDQEVALAKEAARREREIEAGKRKPLEGSPAAKPKKRKTTARNYQPPEPAADCYRIQRGEWLMDYHRDTHQLMYRFRVLTPLKGFDFQLEE